MKRRSGKLFILYFSLFSVACFGDVQVQGAALPEIVRPGSTSQHVEALGAESGIWGTLEQGLEAWVYPFKVFDSVQIGLLRVDGVFQSLAEHIHEQTVTPVEATLEFRDDDWALTAELYVPRAFPGGNLRFEGTLPEGHSLALQFRPVLTPMHRDIEQRFSMAWFPERRALRFENHSLAVRLFFSGESLRHAERAADGMAILDLGSGVHQGVDLSFELQTDFGADRGVDWEALGDLRDRTYATSVEHYRILMAQMPRVVTPDPEVNRALLSAGISLDQLRIHNPDLGWGLVSGFSSSKGGTRPKYAWFFEEPTLSSWSFHRLGLSEHIKESLEFLSKYHRDDGKSVHEVSQSLRYWPDYFDSFKYAYMHTDGPVYYLVAYGHYLRSTGDIDWIQSTGIP